MKKRAYIETYGCQMNVHDSERAAALLSSIDYEIVGSAEQASLVLLNTCAVREKASAKVFARTAQFESRDRATSPHTIIGVMGCVAQADAEAIFERAPEVRIVLGPSSLPSLPDLIRQIEDGFPRVIDIRKDSAPDFLEISATERLTRYRAYITVTEGCDKVCSYCIVPFTRGRERSRAAESILSEAQQLRKADFQEIQLLGQNVNSYRGPMAPSSDEICTFPQLLQLVSEKSGFERIKFTTSHPSDFTGEIVRVMDEHPNLCDWIHLPVQSGSSRVLEAMRRDYRRADYLRKIELIRKAKRKYAITTDIIVGFPGESEEDFKQTLSMVEEVEFDGAYMFKYSPRPHSSAIHCGDDVSPSIKQERLERLQEVQAYSQRRIYQRLLGEVFEVLVEDASSRSPDELSGHSTCNKVVTFRGTTDLLGSIVRVRVTGVHKNSLSGELT